MKKRDDWECWMQEMRPAGAAGGGSNKTVHDRLALAQRFCERLVVVQNVQIRRVVK